MGDTRSAEVATGFSWGDPALAPHVEALLGEAEELGDERGARLARRYLRAARNRAARNP